jgi:hypothetical protein
MGTPSVQDAAARGRRRPPVSVAQVLSVRQFAQLGDVTVSFGDPNVAGWGGLTSFSGRIGKVVSGAVSESGES